MILKLIDGEIWCCQTDGVTVYDIALTPVRCMNTSSTKDVALPLRGIVVIAKDTLYEKSKSGYENNSLNKSTQFNIISQLTFKCID